jgi:hypothetical protein
MVLGSHQLQGIQLMMVEEVVAVGGTTGGGAMFLVTIEHLWNAEIFVK